MFTDDDAYITLMKVIGFDLPELLQYSRSDKREKRSMKTAGC